jgi:DNA-binding MarR family transcriptional regulator
MTTPNPKWPPVSNAIGAARALNHAAVALLKVPSTLDSQEVADRSTYFASMGVGPSSKRDQNLAALVERIVAGALFGQEIDRDLRSATNIARSVPVLRAVCETLDGYAEQLTQAGHHGIPALEILSPARKQFEAKFWSAELHDLGFRHGFSEAELSVLEKLNSDSWSEHDHPAFNKPQLAKTGLHTETISRVIKRMEIAGFLTSATPEGKTLAEFSLTKRGHAMLTCVLANPSRGLSVG